MEVELRRFFSCIEVQNVCCCCRYLSAYEKNLCQHLHHCSEVHDPNSLAQGRPRMDWRCLETAGMRSVFSARHEKRARRTHLYEDQEENWSA